MPESFLLDPTSEATGTQLDISVDPYAVSAFSSPAPPLETATSGSIDTEGDAINARRHQNRQVSLTVEVTGTSQANLDANVATLEAKVAKLAREGGTFRRVRTDATFRTLDVLTADSYEKSFDVLYFVGNMAVCQINLVAEPYARAAEVTLSAHPETTLPVLVFTDTITGDVPATGRLVITETQAQNQGAVIWGYEGLRYDAATTLFKQAESGTAVTGVVTADATASGGSVMLQTGVQTNADIVKYTALTNRGTFRVLVRMKSSHTTPTVRMGWSYGVTSYGLTQALTFGTSWAVYDLGVIRVDHPLVSKWDFHLYGTTTAGQTISVDWVLLVPIAEGSGQVLLVNPGGAAPVFALDASGTLTIRSDAVVKGTTTVTFPPKYEGDYLTIRPGTVRIVIKGMREFLPNNPTQLSNGPFSDSAIDDISATLSYTPRYLSLT